MPLYSFQKRFAPGVRRGTKRQTIRRRRKRPTMPGETLYLYSSLRTKYSEKLGEARCTNVLPVEIWDGAVKVGPEMLPDDCLDEFARADGFADAEDFFAFWRKTHGLSRAKPLTGFELIQWESGRMIRLEIDYLGGMCPVQAGGKIGDRRFFFYARGATWEFYLADPGVEPLDTAPLRHGDYGPWPQAGYMPKDTAHRIIYKIAREIEEQQS